jgi:hypothetical protein
MSINPAANNKITQGLGGGPKRFAFAPPSRVFAANRAVKKAVRRQNSGSVKFFRQLLMPAI